MPIRSRFAHLDTDTKEEKSDPNEVPLIKCEENPYPYPENLKVEELVPVKLLSPYSVDYVVWNKNYEEWGQKMLDVITSADLLGFINGTVQVPSRTVVTSVDGPNGGDTIHEERENEKYMAWKRSDALVQKWIMNRLTGAMKRRSMLALLRILSKIQTAKDLWEYITEMEQRLRINHYLPLHKAAIKGDWITVDNFIQKDQDAVRARITVNSETALIVAVKMVGGKNLVKSLVEKMKPDDLAICDNSGRTALHWAAGFGNIEAAELLADKNKNLPNMETHFKETPLFYAAEHGDRKMVDLLMRVLDHKLPKDEPGFRILYQLTHSQLFGK
ncbi:hypothetical protein Vadar_008235 [Vaccinium darrowii]|uniref:Uncharacterized protein n=1 Tax=Vaccinium darrowii TaxID=229202 RepID=A0ACB7XY98_9ERIC|nr:hypothetical protein Vadar_008235 [Vaccinium darrowii]